MRKPCGILLTALVLGACSRPPTAGPPASLAPAEEPTAPPEAGDPSSGAAAGSALEDAQFALLAHAFSVELRDVAPDVTRYVTTAAVELGVSAELRAAGRLAEARELREHVYARVLTLQRLEPLRATMPGTWSSITEPSGAPPLPAELLAPVTDRVDALAERAFADVVPTSAPDADAVVAAVERYAASLADEH